MVSVIIPVYNEEKTIGECLATLSRQVGTIMEIIVVDDGSTDSSRSAIQAAVSLDPDHRYTVLSQAKKGPGIARNFGARHAKGTILVFIDADMTFAPDFIAKLIGPILEGKTKGTFTKDEYVSNWENVWARCWNYMEGLHDHRRVPPVYPDTAPVFRAILKDEFDRVGGFDPIGYTDDWTVSRKLGYQSTAAAGATCYHKNPDTLADVFSQSRWIGKNEFLSGSMTRRIVNGIRYFPFVQLILGIIESVRYKEPAMMVFRLIYSAGIWISVVSHGNEKNKS